MAQPTMTVLTVTPQQASWDATVNTQFQTIKAWLEDGPLPIRDVTSLPTASAWNQSILFHDSGGWLLKWSDGTNWITAAYEGTFVSTLGQTITNPPTQTEVQDISDKIDEMIAALKAGHALPAS